MARPLSMRFFQRDTSQVARDLLGCTLVHIVKGKRLAGRIVETEAYLGAKDRAAHTFGGRHTDRVRSMYLAGGHAYVYFVYGMHYCFNVVTRKFNEPEAVLIRALQPLEGLEDMRRKRRAKSDRDLANGPAKLCEALGINRSCDGLALNSETGLFIEAARNKIAPDLIVAGPRVGVDYAGEAAAWPLRFTLKALNK